MNLFPDDKMYLCMIMFSHKITIDTLFTYIIIMFVNTYIFRNLDRPKRKREEEGEEVIQENINLRLIYIYT